MNCVVVYNTIVIMMELSTLVVCLNSSWITTKYWNEINETGARQDNFACDPFIFHACLLLWLFNTCSYFSGEKKAAQCMPLPHCTAAHKCTQHIYTILAIFVHNYGTLPMASLMPHTLSTLCVCVWCVYVPICLLYVSPTKIKQLRRY